MAILLQSAFIAKEGFMKNTQNKNLAVAIVSTLFLGSLVLGETNADNTKVNERDQSTAELTADQQKMNSADSKISSKIRQDLMDAEDLSTYAQNVKIITINGQVTLKGPVRSKNERARVLKMARTVAGNANVKNELSIAPEKKTE